MGRKRGEANTHTQRRFERHVHTTQEFDKKKKVEKERVSFVVRALASRGRGGRGSTRTTGSDRDDKGRNKASRHTHTHRERQRHSAGALWDHSTQSAAPGRKEAEEGGKRQEQGKEVTRGNDVVRVSAPTPALAHLESGDDDARGAQRCSWWMGDGEVEEGRGGVGSSESFLPTCSRAGAVGSRSTDVCRGSRRTHEGPTTAEWRRERRDGERSSGCEKKSARAEPELPGRRGRAGRGEEWRGKQNARVHTAT